MKTSQANEAEFLAVKHDFDNQMRALTAVLFRIVQAAVVLAVCLGAAQGIHKLFVSVGVLLLRTIGAAN